MPQLDFETLNFKKDENGKSQLSTQQKDDISTLFCKLTDGNKLFVLSPEKVLPNEILDKYRDKGYDFDFSKVNLPKEPLSVNHKKYYWYFTQQDAFSETYNQLKYDVKYAHNNRHIENPNYHYFIVEEDENYNHMVRGLVKGTYKEGFSFFINPEHRSRIEGRKNNAFDWSSKFSDIVEHDSLQTYQSKIDDCLKSTNYAFTNSNPTSGGEGR